MEHAPEIDFVWIHTTHNVPLLMPENPVPLQETVRDVQDVWRQESVPVTGISVTTRYNVGHFNNLVFLLFDSNWGMRETHDFEKYTLDRGFHENGALDPAPAGYDEDGWPLLT